MYAMKILQVKYFHPQLGQRGFREEWGTTSLLIYLKNSLFEDDNMVTLDFVLCVMKSIIALKKLGFMRHHLF